MRLTNNITRPFQRFKTFAMHQMVPAAILEEDSLSYWRVRILFAIIFTGLVTGLFVFVPLVVMAIKGKLWGLLIFDGTVWLLGIGLLLIRGLRYDIRAGVALLVVYFMGVVIIVSVGLLSGGPAALFAFAVLVGVLLGSKAAILALIVNALTLAVIGWIIHAGLMGQAFPFFNSIERMITSGATFMLLNTIAAMSVAALVKGLIATHQKERELTRALKREQARLIEMNNKLELEVEERKQVEIALRVSKEKFRGLASSLPQIVFETDVTGNLTFVNQNAFDLFGYTEAEFEKGLNALQMILPKEHDRALENIQKVLNGDILGGIEYTAIRKDGTTFPVAIHSNLFRRDNEPAGLRGLIIDLSERKKMETDIKRRAMAMDQSTETIVITDTKGLITYVNPAFEKTTGYSRKEALGKSPRILQSGKHDEIFYRELWQTISSGKTWRGCFTNKKKDGSQYTEEATISPVFSEKGKIVNYVAVKRDISDRLKLEARLQQSKKMEAIGLLAGGVAHDLNNVLSGIVSYPDLLLMDLRKDSPLRKPVLTIQKSGQKAADIVQDLLTLARRGVTNKNVLNLNEIILDYLKSPEYEKLITYHSSIAVETDLDKKLMNIEGSPIQLRKVIMNLVSNAAEAQPSGGRIIIATRNQYVDRPIKGYEEIEEGEFVVLEVKDNGFGIAAEDLTRIFEPFYTKKVMGRSGTGLGMAVVWGTIHDHNGYIDIESTEGIGTTCALFFPVSRGLYVRPADLIPVEEYLGRQETVLVVDDIREQRDIATNILEKLNYSVATVSCGEDAVRYMEKKSVDLLVLDMIMEPGIDGLETYRRIKTLHPDQKAIITSGYSETDRVKEAQRLGAGEYIKKPYTLETIGLAVKKELEK